MKIASRFLLEFPIALQSGEAEDTAWEPKVTGISRNLSTSGLMITLDESPALEPGLSVRVNIELDPEDGGPKSLCLNARVIWSDESRCGLVIQSMSTEERKFYNGLLVGYQTLCRGFADIQLVG